MFSDDSLPLTFLGHVSDVLGDTHAGLSGSIIVQATRAYASEYGISLPHAIYPNEAPNKRTALLENLRCFSASQQHRIIRELCVHRAFGLKESADRRQIKIELASKYAEYDLETGADEVSEPLIEETRHWLMAFPECLAIYNEAISKYRGDVFQRNVLDDLRLALETLLKKLFTNQKSLENQIGAVGSFLKEKGGSTELSNMFVKLVEYYCKYQNSYVKHNNAVIDPEIEFMIEITSSFMKHLVRLNNEP